MASLFGLAFLAFGWRTGLSRLGDNSFFWHLRTGHWILDNVAVPRQDLYSFTAPGANWVAQSWLAEALYGALDALFGAFGVRVLGGLTGAGVAVGTFGLALRLAKDRVRASLLAAAALGASFTLWSERPLFLGLLAFVVLLWVVEVPESVLGRRPAVAIPVLMWLWANIHGTFALGFLYLGLHLLGRWLEGSAPWARRERSVATGSLVAFGVAFLNPYGPALVTFPVQLLARGDILRKVTEWRSPDFRMLPGACFAGWVAVYVACLGLGRRRPTRRDLVVSVPFLLLALWAQRNIALAPLVGMAVAARSVAAEPRVDAGAPRLNLAIAALLVVLGLAWTAEAAGERDFNFKDYPVAAMRAVEERGLLGERLLTDEAWAGYVILRFGPRQPVFLDDRFDMYPPRVTRDFLRFNEVSPGWEGVLRRYRVEVIVWERGHPMNELLEREPGWRRVYRDRLAVVYTRT